MPIHSPADPAGAIEVMVKFSASALPAGAAAKHRNPRVAGSQRQRSRAAASQIVPSVSAVMAKTDASGSASGREGSGR